MASYHYMLQKRSEHWQSLYDSENHKFWNFLKKKSFKEIFSLDKRGVPMPDRL